jgi:hypothetical protein
MKARVGRGRQLVAQVRGEDVRAGRSDPFVVGVVGDGLGLGWWEGDLSAG